MTDYDLTEGDVLYDNRFDEEYTVTELNSVWVYLDDGSVQHRRSLIRARLKNGRFEHRPIRVDGGEESAETAIVEIEGTKEQLDEIFMSLIHRQNRLDEYECDYPDEKRFLREVSLSVYEAMDELDDITEEL